MNLGFRSLLTQDSRGLGGNEQREPSIGRLHHCDLSNNELAFKVLEERYHAHLWKAIPMSGLSTDIGMIITPWLGL